MQAEVSLSDRVEIERFVLVVNLGVLDAIKNGAMTTEEAYYYFHKPYVVELIRRISGEGKLVNLLEDCCMLDDVRTMAPGAFQGSVAEYKKTTIELLNDLPKESEPRCWFDTVSLG